MIRVDNKDRSSINMKSKSVSRKIFSRLWKQSQIKWSIPNRKDYWNAFLVKKLTQKWRWRWNRKSSNVWKQVRFLNKFNVNGLQVIKVSKHSRVKKILDKWLVWRYWFRRNNLRFGSSLLVRSRLDQMLVAMGSAKNITEARLRILHGTVIINGEVNFNYNAMIMMNDIIQLRNNS